MRIVLESKKLDGGFEEPIAVVVVREVAGFTEIVFFHKRSKTLKPIAYFPSLVTDAKVAIPKKYLEYFDPEVFPEVVRDG